MNTTPAERLRWARRRAGYASAAAFARAAEVPEVTYRAHEKGPRAVGGRGLSERSARTYAERLGVSWAWLLTGVGNPQDRDPATETRRAPQTAGAEAGNAGTVAVLPARAPGNGAPHAERVELPPVAAMTRDVPVRGIAVGGDDGCFEYNGEVVDYVLRPPGIERARNVFAIYVHGSSMAPRFEEGDLVFVHPGRPPVNGCDVLVELTGEDESHGPCYIKRLVRRTPTKLVLQQFNPARSDIEIPLKRLRVLYRILTPAELLGI